MSPAAQLCSVVTVLVACSALAACGSRAPAPSTGGPAPAHDEGVTGLHWQLERVDGPTGATRLPGNLHAWLEVDGLGHASGSDGCATFHATSDLSATTIRLTDVSATANGCVSDHGPLDATRAAVDRVLLSGHPATVARTAERLAISGTRHALTYVSSGPASIGG